MLKQKPERMTYAQEKLIKLIVERKLRHWCQDNGLEHSVMYRLAFGEQLPTYKIIASMCHLISPIEWLFYTDEKLPYEPALIPQWSCEVPSKYVKSHRYDFRTIAEKYGILQSTAYKIFVSNRSNPSPLLIRKACDEVNPIDFFTDGEGEIKSLRDFIPERGDIVGVGGRIFFVITQKSINEKNKTYTGCAIQSEAENGIILSNTLTKGIVCPYNLSSFSIANNSPRILIEKADAEFAEIIIHEARKCLD